MISSINILLKDHIVLLSIELKSWRAFAEMGKKGDELIVEYQTYVFTLFYYSKLINIEKSQIIVYCPNFLMVSHQKTIIVFSQKTIYLGEVIIG